jgi:hypothetical protein
LIGVIYPILQNEREALTNFYENSPFTAGSILHDLWRRRVLGSGVSRRNFTFDNPEFEREFLELIKVAGAISGLTRRSAISEEEGEDAADGPSFQDERFKRAADALRALPQQALVSDYYESVVPEIGEMLDGPLAVFKAVRTEGPKHNLLDERSNALALLLATVTDLALSYYNWLIKTQCVVARDFGIDEGQLLGRTSNLLRHYRTLLPSNPAGAAFRLFYDEPSNETRTAMGGKLTLITHMGVGRHLLTHLHDLLASEGQAGPHVLMFSGTSWAGGSTRRTNPKTAELIDAASPCFDVQVPVRGVLVQPEAELEAIKQSAFELVNVRDNEGKQLQISGVNQRQRRINLGAIAERLARGAMA